MLNDERHLLCNKIYTFSHGTQILFEQFELKLFFLNAHFLPAQISTNESKCIRLVRNYSRIDYTPKTEALNLINREARRA